MSTLRKAHTHSPLCSPHIYMFYSPFPHGSQREATVRLLPHSVNTVTTLMTLNRGFLPTSDQHWIAALTPPQAPGFAVSSWWWTPIPSSSLYTLPFRSQVWDDGREVSSMPEGKGSRKRREVPGWGGENPLYIHTQTAWLAGWLSIWNCKSFPLYLHHLLFSELHLFYPQKKQNQTKNQ